MLNQDYLTVRLVRLKPSEEWSNERGRLSFIFPKAGHGRYVSGPVAHRLSPGDVLVVNAASEDKIGIPGTGELVFWCFSVCFENLFPLFASNEICLLQSITDGLKKAKFYPASTPLAAECHRLLADIPPHAELGHRGQLLRIVAALLSMEFKNARRQRVGFVRVEEHMSQVFENLPAAEILNLSVDELATKFGCSRRHLSRLFHQYFGMSIAALRMEMRLLKAVSLLRNRDAKITNVAEECGFNHLGLFNTCFKRRFGDSPGQWRKSAEQANCPPTGEIENDLACPLRSNGLCPLSASPTANFSLATKEALPSRKAGSKWVLKSISQLAGASRQEIREEVHPRNTLRICA